MLDYDYALEFVKRVVDGDTVDLWVIKTMDFGFGHTSTDHHVGRFRVVTVECPERGKPGFVEATTFTRDWLARQANLRVTTHKDPDNFGRYLADVYSPTESLASALLQSGNAVVYTR